MIKNGSYKPIELEEHKRLTIYIDTIYKKLINVYKYIEIDNIKDSDNNEFQMVIQSEGFIKSNLRSPDEATFVITLNSNNKFINGEIYFNKKNYTSDNRNEYLGMCSKYVKWLTNLHGLLKKMDSVTQ